MIIGLGSDLCNIERIQNSLNRFGERFENRVFTDVERAKDIGVVNAPSGAPTLALTGGAKARLDAMVPNGYEAHIHLTLTDDHPWAQAFVIIEALPISKA